MKEILSILGVILLAIALTLQIAIDQPLITILLLWIYVVVRNVQSMVQ